MMNISSILSYYQSQQLLQANATGATSSTATTGGVSGALNSALSKATARIDQQIASTKVQVSAYGQLQSGVAQVEDAASSLASGKLTTLAGMTAGVQSLVDAYNNTRSVSATTEGAAATTTASTLRKAAASDSSQAAWQALGVTVKQDGSLSFDSKALAANYQASSSNVQSAATTLGGTMDKAADKLLSGSSTLSTTISRLDSQSQTLSTLKSAQETRASTLQSTYASQGSTLYSTLSGLQSYLSILSM